MVTAEDIFLADAIYVFHIMVVLFVLFAPFTNIPSLLILHITLGLSLIVHWKMNSNVCALSVLESQLRGMDRSDTFTHKFIAPLYEISDHEWNVIIHIITWVVMGISAYNLYHSDKFKQFLREWNTDSDLIKKFEILFTM